MNRFASPTLSRSLCGAGLLLLSAGSLHGQRRPVVADSVTRAAIDSFVITVRDMAAWALVTPAAHVPVGALQDANGNVESVVGSQTSRTLLTPDSVLVSFRQALGVGARARRSDAIGLAYFRSLVPPRGTAAVRVLVVEVEHRSGYHATVAFPFEHTQETPEFRAPFPLPVQLQEFDGGQKKSGATRRRPRSKDDPR
jgi:hypothetical protein